MGWDPVGDVKDAFESAFNAVGDFFSDPLGAIEDIFNSALDIITLGAFSYAKDQLRDFLEFEIPYQDRKRLVRSAAGARQFVYGRTRVGGQLVYIESWFKDRRFITMTIVVAAHEVDGIEAVYADGRLVASERGSGNGIMPAVKDGLFNETGFENRLLCWSAKGDQTAWVPPTVTPSGVPSNPPGLNSTHILKGMAFVHIFCWYDEERFQTGIPKFEIELRGKNNIYDPRTQTTGYTDNQALCTLDIIRESRWLDVPDADIDMAAFSTAADIADEMVANGPGTTEKRYTVNGSVPVDRPPLDVLSSFARAGAGFPVYTQGQWTYTPGAYTAPVMSLDESDLVGGLSFQPGPGKKSRHNKATGTYVDASQNFETLEFSQLLIQAYVDDDLEVLEKPFEFALTDSGTMARRLAKIDIERNRFGISVQLVAKFKALQLTPGDRINLTVDNLGWSPKVFRVESTEFSFQSGVKLNLREDDPSIYDWEEGDVLELDQPPVIQVPDRIQISEPENITVTEELYRTITRNNVKVRISVSWDADENRVASGYDIQFKKSENTVWIDAATFWSDNTIEIDDVEDTEYDIRVRAINIIGKRSDWTEINYTVAGKSAPPPDVDLLLVEKGKLRWAYTNEPVDLDGFKVRFQNGDRRTWSDATPIHEGVITETVFDVSEFSGLKTFLVKAVDTTGNDSVNAAILVQSLGDIPVKNVVFTQNEFPDWLGTQDTYSFQVVTNGAKEPFNVMFGGAQDDLKVDSRASYSGASVNDDNYLEAEQVGGFYAESSSLFYSQTPLVDSFEVVVGGVPEQFQVVSGGVGEDLQTLQSDDFYGSQYFALQFTWPLDVSATDEGASLQIEEDMINGVNDKIDYKPPGYAGDFIAFPGVIAATEGRYFFRYTVPAQQSASPPIVRDLVTTLDVDDISERLGDVSLDAAGTRLPITRNYRDIVVVNLTLQDTGTGAESLRIIDKDESLGPLVRAFDSAGSGVGATIDALIQGF